MGQQNFNNRQSPNAVEDQEAVTALGDQLHAIDPNRADPSGQDFLAETERAVTGRELPENEAESGMLMQISLSNASGLAAAATELSSRG